jgi:hypothetical protein
VKVAATRARSATLIDPLRTLIDSAAANSVMTQSLISSVSGSCRPQPVLHAAGGGARERRNKHRRIKVKSSVAVSVARRPDKILGGLAAPGQRDGNSLQDRDVNPLSRTSDRTEVPPPVSLAS